MGLVTYHVYCRVVGSTVAILLHCCSGIAMLLTLRGDILKDPEIATLKATQFKYITVWNVMFQVIFSFMNLFCDIPLILKIQKENQFVEYLKKYRTVFFAGVVWPLSLAIFSFFWPLFTYDRELVFPAFIDKAVSNVSNHIMHTAIFPIALWELCFQPRRKPRSHKLYLGHMAVIFVSYMVLLLADYHERGSFPYPMLNQMYGTVYFPLTLIFTGVMYIVYYFIQWPLTRMIYGTYVKTEKIR